MNEISSSDYDTKRNQEKKTERSLLEMASFDDLPGFEQALEKGENLDKPEDWYGRIIGTNKMGCDKKTVLMIASLYGSLNVLRFILVQFPHPEALVTQVCGLDRITSLHCAAASASPHALEIVGLLLKHGAFCDARDALGRRPVDVVEVTPETVHMRSALEGMLKLGEMSEKAVNVCFGLPTGLQISSDKEIEELLQLGFLVKDNEFVSETKSDAILSAKGNAFESLSVSTLTMKPLSSAESSTFLSWPISSLKSLDNPSPKLVGEAAGNSSLAPPADLKKERKKESFINVLKNVFSTDEFRMFSFKVLPCSRPYSHDWTECPFVHPGENARRRDPRKFNYTCTPCPDLRKGSCPKGDACGYAHGVFECWLHPTQYRTRLCKDGICCARRVCFFAHSAEELRPQYQSSNPRDSLPQIKTVSPPLSPLISSPMFAPPPSFSPCNASSVYTPLSRSLPSQNSSFGIVFVDPDVPSGGLHANRPRAALNARDIPHEELGSNFDSILADFSSFSATETAHGVAKTGNFASLGLNPHPINLQDAYSFKRSSSPVSLCHNHNSFQNHPQLQSLQAQIGLFNSPISSSSSQRLAQPQLPVSNPSPMQSSTPKSVHNFGSLTPTLPMDSSTVSLSSDVSANLLQRTFAPLSKNDRGSWSSRDLSGSTSVPLSSCSGWVSPCGKPDWEVQGQHLGKLKISAACDSHGATDPDASLVQILVKDSLADPDESG